MNLNPAMVLVLFLNEARMLLRDKRSILVSIILPLLLMPLMLFGSIWMQKKREAHLQTTTYLYAVTGPSEATARDLADAIQSRMEARGKTNESGVLKLKEVALNQPWMALTNGEIHFLIEGTKPSEASQRLQRKEGMPELHLNIAFRADRDDASAGVSRLEQALRAIRTERQDQMLAENGFNLRARDVVPITVRNMANPGQVAGLALGRMLTLLLMFFMLMAGAMVASDLIAGEKERGTLETLLTSGATRVDIVMAKQLLITAVAATVTSIQALNLLVYVGLRIIPVPAQLSLAAPPHVALLLLVLFLPVAALVGSVLLLTSGYAKTYKEAQLFFTPVFLVGLTPALVPMLPGLSLHSAIVLVPIANIAMAAKEVLIGIFDWPMLALAWGITAAAAGFAMRLTIRTLSSERLVTSTDSDPAEALGGLPLFERRVMRWFAVLWALLLMLGSYMEGMDVRLQVFLNVVVIFFGASLFLMKKYRLKPREVFALRLPRPIVWPAMLAAAPCGVLAGTGLFLAANRLFPVPNQVIEAFSNQVAPIGIPLWQIFFFVAILPGVMEELAFRGALLYGLHRRMKPWWVALTVGVVFGLFHAALFRLAPTAFLGILLSAVTLLTGSIFPAMVWHTASNALALTAGMKGFPVSDLPRGWFVFGAAGLLGVFWVLWRNRTPYPGLRKMPGHEEQNPEQPAGTEPKP